MSTNLQNERQRLVDEMLAELQEVSDRRTDLLREMFRLIRLSETGNSSLLLGGEIEEEEEELERFLERFDLQKNLETGSILSLEIPDFNLGTHVAKDLTTDEGDESVIGAVPQSDGVDVEGDLQYPSSLIRSRLLDVVEDKGEEGDLQYPNSPPSSARSRLLNVAEDKREEGDLQYPDSTSSPVRSRLLKAGEGKGEEDEAMDVDMPLKSDEPSVPEIREETPVNIEDHEDHEQEVEEQRIPPMTRARTRTASPIASKKRKRRRSDVSDENGHVGLSEKLQTPSDDVRQTRSKSRKVTPPPSAPAAEEDDVDELDIISLFSPSNTSPPRRRTSPRQLRSESVQHQDTSTTKAAVNDEQAEIDTQEIQGEDGQVGPMLVEEQTSSLQGKVSPPSPPIDSTHSPSKSISAQTPPSARRESPIRAPKPREPYIVDTTPLSPPRSPPPPIFVHLPTHQPEKPVYHFTEAQSVASTNEPEIKTENEPTLPAAESERPRAPPVGPKLAKRPVFNYTLPPLSALPAEFHRKGKPPKRKRDKERERSGSDATRKDDWIPLGLAKWAALLVANPAYKRLNRATKCVGTKEWTTATTEVKLVRILERIDVLKRTGKWSFRQLKKQRVAAGLVKTHWDYLMDEMKWMQVDFREERRWKIALAYDLARCVQEWHAAGSHEERIRLGICARWRRPDPLEITSINEHEPMEVDIAPPAEDEHEPPNQEESDQEKDPAEDAVSDIEEEDVEDQRAVTAALMADNAVAESAEITQQLFTVPDPAEAPTITMKLEEVEGADVLHLGERPNGGEDSQNRPEILPGLDGRWTEQPKTEAIDSSDALKETSSNPIMDSQSAAPALTGEVAQKEQKSLWTPEQAKVLRSSVLSLPEETLTITLDQLMPMSDEELMNTLNPDGNFVANHDLTTLFPELQPFSLMDAPNSEIVGPSTDGKKKADKKADKDDPTKRVEETTYTKLCPTSRFMHFKPTLVSALQPAKKWRKGKWMDLDESPVVSDVDSPPPLSGPENSCTLFEGRRITIPFQPPLSLHNYSKIPRVPSRTLPIPWSQTEDALLKSLAERYPSNWRLVADVLNSSRIRTSIDLRTPQECFERWRIKCGLPTRLVHPGNTHNTHLAGSNNNEEGSESNAAPGESIPPPSSSSASVGTSQMTTRGIKRLATSVAQSAAALSINTGTATVESRKRKRHLIIYDALKKVQNRRQRQRKQDEVKYQGTVAPAHDTHHQINNKPRFTPMELSKIKTEKEQKELQMQMMRRRDFELKRQQQQQQHLQTQIQQAQQQQHQQGVALSQNVPQIRTQMMQQAQAAQQARALAQAQVQQSQSQPSHPQLQGQMTNSQPGINGTVPHPSTQYVNHRGSNSPVAQHTSPPRSSATPVNSVGVYPRPNSAQRNVTMAGNQVLPMSGNSVPIARTNNTLAAYLANSGGQYTPEQMSHLMRYQAAQQQQLQMHQQQQQPLQMQMQTGQQNTLQGGMTGYPPTI